jgi:type 1 fimbriae regulatory protein FimB
MISLAWRDGFRVSELIALTWPDIDLKRADMAVTRLNNGKNTRQPLQGDDLRALRKLYRQRTSDEWVFMSERGPFTRRLLRELCQLRRERAG